MVTEMWELVSFYTAEANGLPASSGTEVENRQTVGCVLSRLHNVFVILSQHLTFGRIGVKLQKLWLHQTGIPRWQQRPGSD